MSLQNIFSWLKKLCCCHREEEPASGGANDRFFDFYDCQIRANSVLAVVLQTTIAPPDSPSMPSQYQVLIHCIGVYFSSPYFTDKAEGIALRDKILQQVKGE